MTYLTQLTSHRPWLLGFLAIFLLLPSTARMNQGQPVEILPVDVYWQLVDETLKAVMVLTASIPEDNRLELAQWADRWEAITAVQLKDGTIMPIETSFLVGKLRDPEVSLSQLESLVRALQESEHNWAEPSQGQGSLIPLEEILTQPEFTWTEDEPTIIDRIWQAISEQLLKLLARISPSAASGFGPLIQTALTIAGIVILAGALIFTFRGLLADLVSEADSTNDGELGDEYISADQALQRAQDSSTGGDYRSAVRYLYLSSLLLLEERGLIRYDRSQTNQEYLRSVAGRPELAAVLRDVIDVFDRVWYGFQTLDHAAYAQYRARVEQLRQQK